MLPCRRAGLAAGWPALQLWRGPSGLSRLIQLAGAAEVQVMLSSDSSGRFVGDMQHLFLVATSLAAFLDGSLQAQLNGHSSARAGDSSTSPAAARRLYLAQCPVSAAKSPGGPLQPGPLADLMQDIEIPPLLSGTALTQVNFWASPAPMLSSLHYDPYCNLLNVMEGSKTVRLAPPSATPHLSPQPAFHDSANHAAADLFAPAADAVAGVVEFTLQPGDALFLPEGWWHQVRSVSGTLAVNFWWESRVSQAFGGCMDAYYLRRLAQSLAEQRRQALLEAALAEAAGKDGLAVLGQRWELQHGVPPAQPGHFLDLGGGAVLVSRQLSTAEAGTAEALVQAAARLEGISGCSEPGRGVDDLLCQLAASSYDSLMRVLLYVRQNHPPATMQVLLLRGLGAPGWEVFTTGLEHHAGELAAQGVGRTEDLLAAFYDALYSAVGDREQLLARMLQCKQDLGRQCMQEVLQASLQHG